MPTISAKTMEKMGAHMRASNEVKDVMKTLRDRGDPLAAKLPDVLLEREVRAALEACDRLQLTSDTDRSAFCMLEITAFAGLRDLSKLQGLFDCAGGAPDARMYSLFCATDVLAAVERARG